MFTETRFEFMFSETFFNFMFTGLKSFGNPPFRYIHSPSLFIQCDNTNFEAEKSSTDLKMT